jgi:hypothetical protein
MWKCKHCNQEFNYERTTEKGNHSRHCKSNPKRLETYKSVSVGINKFIDNELGKIKKFTVNCFCCNEDFEVKEREKQFPLKEKYFCSRSCANSMGGKTKAEKYHPNHLELTEQLVCAITNINVSYAVSTK